ncbi:MAG: hypothetical protein WKG00_24360 [Polyangiaceae bacterium]
MTRWFAVLAAPVLLCGCPDGGKVSEEKAAQAAARVAPVVKADVEQVRHGLPEGAKKLGSLLDTDPGANPSGLQRSIGAARAATPQLDTAKSTFFSFADTTGVVVRSEADPDTLAQRSILVPFPALKKALEPSAGVVEVIGDMAELGGVRGKSDRQWVLAHPVKDAEGVVKGMFVTGWSFRRYAYYLEEAAKREQHEDAQKRGEKSVPLLYVFMVHDKQAFGAPLTPPVDEQAIEKLDVVSKTSAGPFRGQVVVTERTFGVAAQRTPELGPDTAVAVLLSEI